ncbi:hypothetical protein A1O3_03703 [Capronia epimyces CBS 606.96]|uniref:Aminotransferase class V domain-containing protein n=1 Tax=Capronia epimyces CBS 606.96 TaxID=1182542 RepID=W9YWT5_9EURO|nr:uncharacterized protein A1O3_03703 [Capronia epimyces CBS 606.96]EXJ86749.1 hypothetical protein A1O3_03703 [Capronia epimyces CBS 606.96]
MGSITIEEVDIAQGRETPFTSQHYQSFSPAEHSKLRHAVPVADEEKNTYLNASFQPPMNLRVKNALDQFLNQATTHAHPKPIWQQTTSESRIKLATYLNVPEHSLAFTRDTTEGLNLFQRSLQFTPGDNVVLLDVEHPNHVYGWLGLVDAGLEVRLVPTGTDTYADADTFQPLVDNRTIAIGLSSIMFHSGQMNNVGDICSRFRPRGIHVLVDLTQHVGVAQLDLTAWNVSAAAFGCHKGLGCPSGLGALYISPDVLPLLRPTPPIVGAGAIANLRADLIANPEVQYHKTSQRYEHLNLSLIGVAALKASLDFLVDDVGIDRVESHLRALGRELALRCKTLGVEVVGSSYADRRAPHLYVLKLLHPDWQSHLRQDHIYVSHYRLGIRVSFGFYNNADDVAELVRSIERGLQKGIPRE